MILPCLWWQSSDLGGQLEKVPVPQISKHIGWNRGRKACFTPPQKGGNGVPAFPFLPHGILAQVMGMEKGRTEEFVSI